MSAHTRTYYIIGCTTLLLAVLLGAFGAHGLKNLVEPQYITTYKTGITYQFYHGFALLFIGVLSQLNPQFSLSKVVTTFILGIFLFCFNCYLYTLTQIKTFAMVVPIGGVCFILGWGFLIALLFKDKKRNIFSSSF